MHEFQITILKQICKHCNYSTSTDRPVVKDSIEDDMADVCNDIYYIPEEKGQRMFSLSFFIYEYNELTASRHELKSCGFMICT